LLEEVECVSADSWKQPPCLRPVQKKSEHIQTMSKCYTYKPCEEFVTSQKLYCAVLFVFQVSRNILAETEPHSDSSADPNLTTYTDFQVCGKWLVMETDLFRSLSQQRNFCSFISHYGISVSAFRTDYTRLLMVLLPLLLVLLHVVSLFWNY